MHYLLIQLQIAWDLAELMSEELTFKGITQLIALLACSPCPIETDTTRMIGWICIINGASGDKINQLICIE